MSGLGELLKELRGKKSLRDIAEETGLSHSYISDVEKGYRRGTNTPINPSPDTLKRLSKAYDYSYEKLMLAAGYMDTESVKRQGRSNKDKDPLDQQHPDESFFYFDEENVTEEEKEELKKHLQYLRWKAQQENKKK